MHHPSYDIPVMILRSLNIISYRNLQEVSLEFSDNVNCFVGNNGMGKTNVLDAVYYLSFCKSSVNSQDSLNLRHGDEFFILDGHYVQETTDVTEHIVCSMKKGLRKRIRRNDKEYKRLAEHIGLIPLVLISPNDQQIVSGGSEERRRFIDAVVAQYDMTYLDHLVRYQRALTQRNTLLKSDEEPDWQYVSIVEEMMADSARYIYRARAEFIEQFTPIFQELYARLCNSQFETPDIRYESHAERGDLLPWLIDWRERERTVGYTLHGPHKDNLQLLLNGFELRREGSQGQTKTYFISMKLAQYIFLTRKSEATKGQSDSSGAPILLLDDIFDKLDAGRVARIVDYVSGGDFGQIFITDTNRQHLDDILSCTVRDYKLFSVENGQVTERTDIVRQIE